MKMQEKAPQTPGDREKKAYQSPTLKRFGSIKEITLGGGVNYIDNRTWKTSARS